jgi:outer membrane lipoprotein-sorting protein
MAGRRVSYCSAVVFAVWNSPSARLVVAVVLAVVLSPRAAEQRTLLLVALLLLAAGILQAVPRALGELGFQFNLGRARWGSPAEGGGSASRTSIPVLLVAASVLLAVACGQTGPTSAKPASRPTITATPAPTAAEVLTKPALSTMKDMHFTATVRATSGGQTAELAGEGDMVVKPSSAFRLEVHGVVGSTSLSEQIITKNGTDYVRQGGQKFMASPSTQASDVNTWQQATDATLLGEEELPTGGAWHVKATSRQGNPFEAWVRKSDGYLLRYFATSKSGNTTFTYSIDRFNTGATIEAPPPSEVA